MWSVSVQAKHSCFISQWEISKFLMEMCEDFVRHCKINILVYAQLALSHLFWDYLNPEIIPIFMTNIIPSFSNCIIKPISLHILHIDLLSNEQQYQFHFKQIFIPFNIESNFKTPSGSKAHSFLSQYYFMYGSHVKKIKFSKILNCFTTFQGIFNSACTK